MASSRPFLSTWRVVDGIAWQVTEKGKCMLTQSPKAGGKVLCPPIEKVLGDNKGMVIANVSPSEYRVNSFLILPIPILPTTTTNYYYYYY
jgi:hypothetical protein